jgi:3-hydroxybutyryl-CoA dehydrogenase
LSETSNRQIDRYTPSNAILATNSSAIVSSRIADVTNRPEKVINLHFFNPALVMKSAYSCWY